MSTDKPVTITRTFAVPPSSVTECKGCEQTNNIGWRCKAGYSHGYFNDRPSLCVDAAREAERAEAKCLACEGVGYFTLETVDRGSYTEACYRCHGTGKAGG